jgi:hypothetical protein
VPHAENLCGSFWWKDVLKLLDNFRGIVAVKMGKGNTFLFWSDNWIVNQGNVPLKSRFPRLFSYVLNENVSAAEAYSTVELEDMFYLPLSTIAYQELQELKQVMETNLVLDQQDVWSYCWGPKYTTAQFYRKIHAHIKVPNIYRWLWKSCCIMRHKMFVWLVLRDRVNTRDLLQRRH